MLGKIFKFITAGGKTTEQILDKDNGLLTQVGGWIGNAQFTEEERAEFNRDLAAGVRTFAIETMNESTDRSKARRSIAVLTVQMFFLLLFAAGALFPFDREWSAFVFNLTTTPVFGGLVVSISIFFFGSHAAAKWKKEK